MRRAILASLLAAVVACADRLTGPDAQSAAAAYRNHAIEPSTRLFINGVERDPSFLRMIDAKLVDSMFLNVTKTMVADGTDSQKSEIRVYMRPLKRR